MSSQLAGAIEDEELHFDSRLPPAHEITAVQRMISACLGSLVTSFVVTPFDVVRIRIHQQGVMTTCCDVAESAAVNAAPKQSPGVFWATQAYCPHSQECPRITSTFQGMVAISRNEGLPTLWRGLGLTLFMGVPSNIIYFTGYEYIRDMSPMLDHPLNPLVCGLLARTISATTVAPIELFKTRFQSIPSQNTQEPRSKVFKSLLKDTREAFRKTGTRSLFTGLQITLWRDVPFLGIYWLCYEYFKEQFSAALNVDHNNTHQDWKVFATSFLSGSLGGAISAFFTNPFDVGKTRLQITTQNEPHRRVSMFKFLYQILRTEGVGALYSGFGPRVMKIAPSCAIMISSYELGKQIFKNLSIENA